ncbi:hypothetical protein Tco_1299672 [Tanacetum coccineum]
MYEAREEMHEEVQQSADEEEEPTEQPIPEPSNEKTRPEPSLEASKEPEPSHTHSDSKSSAGSLDFKVFDNNVPTTKRILARNLQNFSSFLYAQLFEDNWVKHEEAAASYADLRVVVEEYAEENEEHRTQTDKAIDSVMECVEKINKARVDERTTLLKSSNRVSKTLEADSTLKATMQKMSKTNTTTSGNIINLTELLRNANLLDIITQNSARLTEIASSLKEINFPSLQTRITNVENTHVTMQFDIYSIKEMVTEMFKTFKGLSSSTPSGSAVIPTITPPEANATVWGGEF